MFVNANRRRRVLRLVQKKSRPICVRKTNNGLDFKCPPPHGIPREWRFVSWLKMDLLYFEYFGSTSNHFAKLYLVWVLEWDLIINKVSLWLIVIRLTNSNQFRTTRICKEGAIRSFIYLFLRLLLFVFLLLRVSEKQIFKPPNLGYLSRVDGWVINWT